MQRNLLVGWASLFTDQYYYGGNLSRKSGEIPPHFPCSIFGHCPYFKQCTRHLVESRSDVWDYDSLDLE